MQKPQISNRRDAGQSTSYKIERWPWVETDEKHLAGAVGSLLLRKLPIKLTIAVDSELVEPATTCQSNYWVSS